MIINFDVTLVFGSLEHIDVENPEFREALRQMEKQMAEKIESNLIYRVLKVDSAKSQRVKNTLYKTKLIMGETPCKKTDIDHINIDSCLFTGNQLYCGAEIYKQFNAGYTLQKFQCIY
ncbi:uncharacterized protein LOC113796638 [Dermatophagoides pteronyssinus]